MPADPHHLGNSRGQYTCVGGPLPAPANLLLTSLQSCPATMRLCSPHCNSCMTMHHVGRQQLRNQANCTTHTADSPAGSVCVYTYRDTMLRSAVAAWPPTAHLVAWVPWPPVAPPGTAPSFPPSPHASSTPTRSHTAPCQAVATGSSQHHRMRLDATSQRWPNLGTPGQACPVTPVPQTAKQPNLHCSTHSPCLACRAAMDIPGAKPLPTSSTVRCC